MGIIERIRHNDSSALKRAFQTFDSWLGGLVCSFTCIFVTIVLTFAVTSRALKSTNLLIKSFGWAFEAAIVVLEIYFLFLVWRNAGAKRFPVALTVAQDHFTAPIVLRPLFALFWLFHLFITILLAAGLRDVANIAPRIGAAFAIFFSFAFEFITYGFAVLSVVSLKKNDAILKRVWRARTAYSIVVAVLLFFVEKHLRSFDQIFLW